MNIEKNAIDPHLRVYRLARELERKRKFWLSILGGQPSPLWQPNEKLSDFLVSKLSLMHADGKPSETLYQVCRQITAGGYLVGSALDWKKPMLGNGSSVAETRGTQWRLTVAWAGLETLIAPTIGGLQCKHLQHLATLTIPQKEVPPLSAPSGSMRRLREAREWPQTGSKPAMLEYIGAGSGFAAEMLKRWLYEGKPLVLAHEQLGLAQALRHATAHGALSSTGLVGWGIRPALIPLTALIAQASVGLFRALINDATTIKNAPSSSKQCGHRSPKPQG
jgi:hypothetical protein